MTLTPYTDPGKYEGGLALDPVFYELSLAGCDAECGDVDASGWAGRLDGPFKTDGPLADISATARLEASLSDEDLAYVRTLAGVIICADSQGFVDVSYYTDRAMLDKEWSDLVSRTEQFNGIADDE